MSAGFFPLDDNGDMANKLHEAHRLIGEVIDAVWDSVYCGEDGQFDNSATDGGAIALLRLAQDLILGRIEKE